MLGCLFTAHEADKIFLLARHFALPLLRLIFEQNDRLAGLIYCRWVTILNLNAQVSLDLGLQLLQLVEDLLVKHL